MNFDFSESQQLLREQAQRFLRERSPLTLARAALQSEAGYFHDAGLWQAVADLGWTAATIAEDYGGAGLGYLELCVLAEELGRALTPLPFASSVYLASEIILGAAGAEQKQQYLPKLASGEQIGTLALAEERGVPTPARIATRWRSGRLNGVKQPVPDGLIADFAIVAAHHGDRHDASSIGLYRVELDAPGVARELLRSLDPTRPLARLRFDNAPAVLLQSDETGWQLLDRVIDRAAVLIAFEQLGGAQAALDMAKEYALQRQAFGRPIGSFQAIKHKLADIYIAIELARSNCYFGAWALACDAPELPSAAATARISAGQAFQLAAQENIQVHGAMGFTWEADCQLYYRRAKYLALLLGSDRRWKDLLIQRLTECHNT